MASIFTLPRSVLLDPDGIPISGGNVRFYDAGTTTPRTVYSDSDLSIAISQPVQSDSAGRLPLIYMATGAYKIVVSDDDDVTIYTADNLDSGIPAGSGALAVANGGTGATSASAARTSLGAASQSEVDNLASSVSDIEGQIDDVGGELGALAGLDKIGTDQLDTGFGVATLQSVTVASTANVVTCSDTIPYDNTIPQNSEGTQVLSGSFTPKSASSTLKIEIELCCTASSDTSVGLALFRDTTADAIAAAWNAQESNNQMQVTRLTHYMSSPGTSAVTLSVRVGAATGTVYVNGNNSGTRVGGGVVRALLRVTELRTF